MKDGDETAESEIGDGFERSCSAAIWSVSGGQDCIGYGKLDSVCLDIRKLPQIAVELIERHPRIVGKRTDVIARPFARGARGAAE